MAIEPASAPLLAQINQDEARPSQYAAFLAWAAARQRQYERERAAWRQAHPLIDVGALEAYFGVTPDILTVEQLRKSAPPVILGGPAEQLPEGLPRRP